MATTKQITITEYNGTDYDIILPKSVYTVTGTLLGTGWSSNQQTLNIPQVMADSAVIVSSTPADADKYTNSGILCTAQGDGTLTFTRKREATSANIGVNIFIL